MSLQIDDRIALKGKVFGTLRYIGPIKSKEGIWAGIELDDPLGKTDGEVMGVRYFTCRMKHALFVKYERLIQNIKPIDVLSIDKDSSHLSHKKDVGSFSYDITPRHEFDSRDYFMGSSKNLYPKRKDPAESAENHSKFENQADLLVGNSSLFEEDNFKKEIGFLSSEQALHENTKYKMLVQYLLGKFSTVLDSIMDRLNKLNSKVECVKKYYKTEKERDKVVSLVEGIFKSTRYGDRGQTSTFLDEFKNIMKKYDIKID